MPEPIPEAPQNFGWKDFTGSGRVSERDMQWIYDAFIKHLGQDYWNSRNEYPHPNQAVSVLNFFEGNGQLNNDGIFIVGDSSQPRGLVWVPTFESIIPPPFENPYAYVVTEFPGSTARLTTGTFHNLTAAQALFESIDSDQSSITLSGLSNGGGAASVEIGFTPTINALSLTNMVLALASVTSDFTGLSDGMMWYRSDTDAFRVRINGVTRSLLTDAYVPPVTPMTSLDLPYAATSSTPVGPGTTDCFIDIDATAGTRTVNLPSAVTVTSGFTYIIRKVDSSANTIVVDPNGAQTINGATTYTLTKQYETLTIVSNGANWDIWTAYQAPSTGISTKTTAYTAVPADSVILCDATAGAFTVTLPAVASSAGTTITIKKIDSSANVVTVDGNASETIDGVLTKGLSMQYNWITVAATAAAWFIVGAG